MMGGSPVSEALIFLISTLFGLFILVVALRFLLQLVRADFYNPISQFLVTVTNPALRPLRRFIPGYGGIDFSSILLMLVLKICEICLIGMIGPGRIPAIPGLFVISVADLMQLTIYIFEVAIIIQIIISWINPGAYNPVTIILYRLTEPLLRPARQLIPPISGLDFSPMAVLIGLQLVIILAIKPLARLGYALGGYGF